MTVAVGFAPAAAGLVTGGATAAPEGDVPEGLFAALLALVAPEVAADAQAAAETISSTDFAALVRQAVPAVAGASADEAVPAESAIEVTTPVADPGQVQQGKSLLKSLGAALIAINDALEAGKPIDPALDRKLAEAVDAVGAYLGVTVAPPAPGVDPRISALATGAGVLPPATPAELPPTTPVEPAVPAIPVEPASEAPSETATATPLIPVAMALAPALPQSELTEAAAELAAAIDKLAPAAAAPVAAAAPAVPTEETAPVASTKPEATAPEEAPPALRELGALIEKLAKKLEPQDPALAKKLAALAGTLEDGTASAEMMAALGIEDAEGDPDLARVVAALTPVRPGPKSVTDPQRFTPPSLDLPDAVVQPGKAADTERSEAASATALNLDAAPVQVAKPAATAAVEAKTKPSDKPAAPTSADTEPVRAAENPAQAGAPTPQQPAAVPVARTVHAAYQVPVQQLNLPQVAFEIVRQFDAGNSRFQIRLDPPELGRIDVKLDVDKSGTVNARMVVERPETLDLMQRDQRALQQALQQAGLDAARTNLEFSLRQNPFTAQGGMGDGRGHQPTVGGSEGLGTEDTATETGTTAYRGTATAGGVNLFV